MHVGKLELSSRMREFPAGKPTEGRGEWVEDDIRLERESKIAKKEWAPLGADASVLDNWPLPGCWAW